MLYKFKKPFKYGTETVESVELKEDYTAGDLMRIQNAKGDGDKIGAAIVAATNWPLPKVAMIPFNDAVAIQSTVLDFLEIGETDG